MQEQGAFSSAFEVFVAFSSENPELLPTLLPLYRPRSKTAASPPSVNLTKSAPPKYSPHHYSTPSSPTTDSEYAKTYAILEIISKNFRWDCESGEIVRRIDVEAKMVGCL